MEENSTRNVAYIRNMTDKQFVISLYPKAKFKTLILRNNKRKIKKKQILSYLMIINCLPLERVHLLILKMIHGNMPDMT